MSRITWDGAGEKRYETGVDHCVLYPKQATSTAISGMKDATTPYSAGVAWNGITTISKTPSGAEPNDIYADNIKYASIRSAETFGGTVEAYTYPPEWAKCDGSATVAGGLYICQQARQTFGLSFRTAIGDDNDSSASSDSKYKLHLVYNATASPSESSFNTINDSPEAITFSWEFTTIPESIGTIGTGASAMTYAPTAVLTIDSTKLADIDQATGKSAKLTAFENILYGTNGSGGSDGTTAMLPLPKDVITFFTAP